MSIKLVNLNIQLVNNNNSLLLNDESLYYHKEDYFLYCLNGGIIQDVILHFDGNHINIKKRYLPYLFQLEQKKKYIDAIVHFDDEISFQNFSIKNNIRVRDLKKEIKKEDNNLRTEKVELYVYERVINNSVELKIRNLITSFCGTDDITFNHQTNRSYVLFNSYLNNNLEDKQSIIDYNLFLDNLDQVHPIRSVNGRKFKHLFP